VFRRKFFKEVTFLASMPIAALNYVPPIDLMIPQRLDVACFGMGHFFDSEPRFGVIKGVWRTMVGYAGGKHESPSYDNVGDHVEVVMVEYDPLTISYGQLLELFLLWHDPEQPPSFPQYASRILAKNEFERRLALAALERHELCSGNVCQTRVSMSKVFYEAEKWCQKYRLRAFSSLMKEVRQIYPDEDRWIRSTLATRLNGILGQRTFSSLCSPEEIGLYGLSEDAIQTLKRLLS
jgi:peptide-methionine (S)-S-oxide reductase